MRRRAALTGLCAGAALLLVAIALVAAEGGPPAGYSGGPGTTRDSRPEDGPPAAGETGDEVHQDHDFDGLNAAAHDEDSRPVAPGATLAQLAARLLQDAHAHAATAALDAARDRLEPLPANMSYAYGAQACSRGVNAQGGWPPGRAAAAGSCHRVIGLAPWKQTYEGMRATACATPHHAWGLCNGAMPASSSPHPVPDYEAYTSMLMSRAPPAGAGPVRRWVHAPWRLVQDPKADPLHLTPATSAALAAAVRRSAAALLGLPPARCQALLSSSVSVAFSVRSPLDLDSSAPRAALQAAFSKVTGGFAASRIAVRLLTPAEAASTPLNVHTKREGGGERGGAGGDTASGAKAAKTSADAAAAQVPAAEASGAASPSSAAGGALAAPLRQVPPLPKRRLAAAPERRLRSQQQLYTGLLPEKRVRAGRGGTRGRTSSVRSSSRQGGQPSISSCTPWHVGREGRAGRTPPFLAAWAERAHCYPAFSHRGARRRPNLPPFRCCR